jgi:choline-sulfatase
VIHGSAKVVACALLATLPSFAESTKTPSAHPVRPNVILITMDTLRADHVGCYGAKDLETPTLDALAHDGVVFERAIAQVPLTWPSHAAILTGTYPFQNGVQDFTGHPLDPRFRSIAQSFRQAGYATGAVVSSFVLDRSWGLARGFDFYDDAFSAAAFQQKDLGLVDRKAQESVTHALHWLDKTPRRPFFLWLHLYDPHSPYDPPEPYRARYHDHLYDGEIAYADHELGRLIIWLKSHRLYDSALIVFVSDHGESLGEHGEQEHGFFIYDSTIRVPLIVKAPALSHVKPGRRAEPVQTIAIGPTVLRLAGIHDAIEKQFQTGHLPQEGEEGDNEAYSETFYPFSSFGWSPLHSLQTSRYHYIEAPKAELYDVGQDPEEENNLAAQQPATVAVLKEKLHQLLTHDPFSSKDSGTTNLSPNAQEKLRALGYVAYRSPVPADALAEGLADPKDKILELNSILNAGDAFRVGDFATGEDLLLQVRAKDPHVSAVPYMLGEAALRQKKWDRSVDELQKALEIDPTFDQAMTALARALHETGDDASARKWLDRALTQNPQNFRAWYELGWIESKNNNRDAAEHAYQKALSLQPNFGLARRDLGLLQFARKNYVEAAKQLAKATESGLEEATLYNFLAISYSQTNQLKEAVRAYRRALDLDPGLAEAHLNLGYAYQRMGKNTLANSEYGAACQLEAKYCPLIPDQHRK